MNYKNINDYEVLYLIEDENDSYKKILYNKYDFVVKNICNKYLTFFSNIFVDKDDLYQEALLGIDYAIHHFDSNKNTIFYTFCTLCVESRVNDFYRKLMTKKNGALSNSISLDTEVGENMLLSDTLSSSDDVCKSVINDENFIKIINFKNSLSVKQAQIFELRMNGFSNKEIATLLSMSVSSVYNQFKKIRNKYYEECN